MVKNSKMEINKNDILEALERIQDQVNGMGFRGTNASDLWRSELTANYIVRKLTVPNVSEIHLCYINGCANTRDKNDCFCDEHLID